MNNKVEALMRTHLPAVGADGARNGKVDWSCRRASAHSQFAGVTERLDWSAGRLDRGCNGT